MCLGGEILEKERVHRTLEPDMELVDLALGQGEQLYPGKGQMLVERGDILLVTGETVERLGDDDFEGAGAGILEQFLIGGPHADRTTHPVITIQISRRPPLRRAATRNAAHP